MLCQVISVQSFNNVLYQNKKLSFFGSSRLCSFCKNVDEKILHLLYECNITKALWKSLISFFDKSLNLPYLLPQTAFLGFTNTYCNDILIKNHILLLFKIYVYNSRKHEKISLNNLTKNVTKVINIEKEIAGNNEKKVILYNKKGEKTENKLNEKTSLIYPKGEGWNIFGENICCFLLLLFYLSLLLFYFFYLFFACVCLFVL